MIYITIGILTLSTALLFAVGGKDDIKDDDFNEDEMFI